MSINGEITAVRISRRSSIADEELHDKPDYNYDYIRPDEDEKARRPISGGRKRTSRPMSGKVPKHKDAVDNSEHIMRADSDQINLEKLLHSMLDLNDNKKNSSALRTQRQRPFSAHQLSAGRGGGGIKQDRPNSVISDDPSFARRQRQRPFSAHDSQLRTNYSFSNDKVDQIDRENQRLLREILKNQAKKVPAKQPVFAKRQEPLKVKSSASLNRMRFQQQVERENLAFLRRLEKIKPTKELSRDHLLREHCKQEQLVSNVSRSKRRPSSAGSIGLSRRSSSMNDLRDLDTVGATSSQMSTQPRKRTGSARRPLSAKSSMTTSKKAVDTRPVWESGW